MKKEYKLAEDLFMAVALLLLVASGILKLFDFSFNFGLSTISALQLFKLAGMCLLINIALNVQELTRK